MVLYIIFLRKADGHDVLPPIATVGRRILFFHANLHILNQPPLPITMSNQPTPEIATESEVSARETSVSTVLSDTDTYLAPAPFEHADYKNVDAATYDAVGLWD